MEPAASESSRDVSRPTEGGTAAPVPQTQRRFAVDRSDVIALIALVVSLVGTIVAVRETQILQEQQALMDAQKSASVLPYVNSDKRFEIRGDTITRVTMTVINTGVGPALLSKLSITLDGDPVSAASLEDRINERYPGMAMTQLFSNTIDGGILPVGEEVALFTLRFDLREMDFTTVTQFMGRVKVEICYCSVYGACWNYRETGWNERSTDCSLPVQVG
ncbi:hypothetical protein GGR28_002462 [Lewinella aquimaris]|uniref:Uncharacterized protein n=1 Tax=Neolewinella aquimaris TaxID=1835722 RepID=A0A840E8B2_9BACT|nr:hypothetical protein [Neolewinella aquimaris]MBB4079835.1 hypothetical protein [Neolewinella aquimaris]